MKHVRLTKIDLVSDDPGYNHGLHDDWELILHVDMISSLQKYPILFGDNNNDYFLRITKNWELKLSVTGYERLKKFTGV